MPTLYPVTPMQAGMLWHSLRAPQEGFYVQQLVCTLSETLAVPQFREAWQRLVDRHAVLRTSFPTADSGEFVQSVADRLECPWEEQDWRGLEVGDASRRFAEWLRTDRTRGLGLACAPLWRLLLIRIADEEYRLIWTSHHALLDGRSRRLLLHELFALYEGWRPDIKPPTLVTLATPADFGEYARWLARQDFSAARKHFTRLLQGFTTATPLPLACAAGVGNGEADRGTIEFALTAAETSELARLAAELGVTFNTLLQGAWALLLSRCSGTEDVLFGATRAGRHSGPAGVDLDSMVGLLINTVPVRVRVNPAGRLDDWLRELRAQWVELREFETTPLATVRACSELPVGSALFETLVVFESFRIETCLQDGNLPGTRRTVRVSGTTNYPLVVSASLGPALNVTLTFDCHRFDDDSVARMGAYLRTLLNGMASRPQALLGELPLLSTGESGREADEWNPPMTGIPRDACLPLLFEAQVTATPEATALVHAATEWTYRELNTRANRLAHHLRALGVGPDVPVAICTERSPQLVVGLLGILKAGGAYVPLDPDCPADRLAFILRDTGARWLLTQPSLLPRLPGNGVHLICLDAAAADSGDPTNPPCELTPENLAYIIYTSGTTGRPKGVRIPQRGVFRLLFDADFARLDSTRTLLHHSSTAFDASTFELWGALLHGGRCVLYPGRLPTLEGLGRLLREQRIDTLFLTTSLFNAVVDESVEILSGIQQLLVGGEALSVRHVRRALECLPNTAISNIYGPTETTTFAACHPIPRDLAADALSVPIGKPIGRTSIHLLDAAGLRVPVGIPGELLIGGPGLALGYHNQPEHTAERFVPDPFSSLPGARLYRTGDLGRRRPDGSIEFLGRLDDQVKIRGYRIEPREIEATLLRHPAVRRAVVVAREAAEGEGRQLVAYVVPHRDAMPPPAPADLRGFLEGLLPDYMVPSAFVRLDELPLSANGKVDRQRLPNPDTHPVEDGTPGAFVAPRTAREKQIAAIFTELLARERVGIHEDFFAAGGHSLTAMRLVSRIRHATGIEVSLPSLFENPSVAGLATFLSGGRNAPVEVSETKPALTRVPRDGPFPLMYSQLSIWDLYRRFGTRAQSNTRRAFRLRGPLDSGALRDALQAVVERHEVLRTRFVLCDGVPQQIVGTAGSLELPVEDLPGFPEAARGAEIQRRYEECSHESFELEKDLLLRARLLRLDAGDHTLLLQVHHIASDAWSAGILNDEFAAAYAAFRARRPWNPPSLPIQPADFAVWERSRLRGELLERQVAFWKNHLAGGIAAGPQRLETVAGVDGFLSDRHTASPSSVLVKALRKLGRQEQCTLAMTLFAALNVHLRQVTGIENVLVGMPLAARARPELEGVLGCFRKRAVLHTDLTGRPSFRELLRRVRQTSLAAYAHQDVSQELVFPERTVDHPAHWSQLPVSFNFMEGLDRLPSLPGLLVSRVPRNIQDSIQTTNIHVVAGPEQVHIHLFARCGMFDPAETERFLAGYVSLLDQLVARPDERLP